MSAPIHGQEIGPDGHPVGSYAADPAGQAAPTAADIEDPDLVRVDPDILTIGEVELVEELSGMSIDTFSRPGTPKAKFMRAMGMVYRRRTDPGFTWEQAAHLRVRMDDGKNVPPQSGNGSGPSQSLPMNSV